MEKSVQEKHIDRLKLATPPHGQVRVLNASRYIYPQLTLLVYSLLATGFHRLQGFHNLLFGKTVQNRSLLKRTDMDAL